MRIMHVALGGCLKAPPIEYGVTEDTGGHIAYVLGAAAAQSALPGNFVEIVTRAFDGLDPVHSRPVEPISPRCRILRLATDNRAYLAKEALEAELPALERAFVALLDRMPQRPDVIHAHFADAARLAMTAQRYFAIPWLYTPHSLGMMKALDPHSPRIRAEARAIRRASAIIVSSRDEAEHQIAAYGDAGAGRVHRVNPGVTMGDDPGIAPARRLIAPFLCHPEKPILLAVARPVRKKNLITLIDAFAGSPQLRQGTNLVILPGQRDGMLDDGAAHGGVVARLFDAIDRADLWGQVALPRRHDATALRSFYALAARGGAFVNPALHEPFGLTLIEAAQAGVPVVATRNGGPVDILNTIRAGALVDPGDPAAIADACLAMLRQSPAVTARAQLLAQRHFDWSVWATQVGRIIHALKAPIVAAPHPTTILASDIDATLTGCTKAAARFGEWHGNRPRRLLFAVATGRSLSEARRVLGAWQLPIPDLFITSVGTEIWRHAAPGCLTLCGDYAALLDRDWNRASILDRLSRKSLTWQAGHEQRRWKLSLFGTAANAIELRDLLAEAGLQAKVIASHGRFIDILPPNAGKGAALRFEAQRHDLSMADCIAAGDSGNDADMLLAAGLAILPANAYPELEKLAGRRILRSRLYYADAVLDGLRHRGVLNRPQAANA
ncbi:HAD-IIB family hydrolase [Paracoccus laeviglucosivorans]|uniref:sucrose-phosphate synthase n=1 Tax=Paracoccus laeviglucosivorans TaxID=1197861 RepID=A0A521EQT7_9RHOB|nr:HAD-IIB family hydrolase [Paracoccus laeviglucosivorans]SMO85781.1 sucrose-phosphate synthase [Paracoccus laeviglucosivorans]